ncbi:MAG TPA: FAD-binding oxidoreductase [Candidatus Limnocylindria bacterium]
MSPTPPTLTEIRALVHGRVIGPEDAEYDAARTVVVGGIDRRPAAIVRVADADDVSRVIGLAREHGLELAVRSGGHSAVGHSVTNGGIVIDLHDMKRLDVDVEGRSAWADAGLTAGEVTTALAEHHLAVGFGDTASVGIGGITLGGGIGYLVRKHGLTIDSLLAAEIVTADGDVLTISETERPDLFWAIRGGGGNFGVVTRFQYRLHPLGQVYGGFLFLPATPETVAGAVAAAEAASEDLSAIINVMPLPPMPFIPEEHAGKMAVFLLGVYSGDPADGAEAFAPFRALAEPFGDLLRPMAYPEIYPPAPEEEYHPIVAQRNMFLDRVDLPVAQTIMERLASIDSPMKAVQLRVLGGAMARVPADATAFAHRSSRIMAQLVAMHSGGTDGEAKQAWVDALASAIQQGDRRAYVNFVADEGLDGVHTAYPGATWDRLVEVKRRYDPTNLFHLNQNVPPTAS